MTDETIHQLNPLDWRAGIVDRAGRPTPEFQRRWLNQAANNQNLNAANQATAAAQAAEAAAQAIINARTGFGFFDGGHLADHELLGAAVFSHNVKFTSPNAGNVVTALVGATGSPTFTMVVSGVTVGTITMAGTVGTVAWSGGSYTLTAGTPISLFAPTPADATLASVSGIVIGAKI